MSATLTPLARLQRRYSDDQPRASNGQFGSGGGSSTLDKIAEPITAEDARGNSRPVSHEEFQALAKEGQDHLDQMAQNSSPITGLTDNLDSVKANAFDEAQKSWGGATIDAHTGEPLETNADKYAITVKPEGQSTVSVPENATKEEFNAAMDKAVGSFTPTLENQDHFLGVFHDDALGRIDIDPVVVVSTPHEVETIGAATHAIGGAYHFASGDGYFPPHVAPTVSERSRLPMAGQGTPLERLHARLRAFRYSDDQPRAENGQFGSGGGGASASSGAMSTHMDSVSINNSAITSALASGGTASCNPEDLQPLLESWRGLDSPINMANLSVNGESTLFDVSSRDLPREAMPVIPGTAEGVGAFADMLGKEGVSAQLENVDPRTLTATQNQLDGLKVAGISSGIPPAGGALVVDKDGNILDGHHRWAANAAYAVGHPGYTVQVLRANTSIDNLLTAGERFDQAQGIEHKPFGQRALIPLGTIEANRPACPDPSKPYIFFDGKWILIATDDSDGVPRKLSFTQTHLLPKPEADK